MITILLTNISAIPNIYSPADVANTIETIAPIKDKTTVALLLEKLNLSCIEIENTSNEDSILVIPAT